MTTNFTNTQITAQGAGMMSAAESEISNNVCVWVGLNNKTENPIGEITLNVTKVDEKTMNWQESFWRVVRLANFVNESPSIVRSAEDKFDNLSEVATLVYSDIALFFTHYQLLADELAKAPKFKEECASLNLTAEIVAQHLVFEGEMMYMLVQEYGAKPFYRTLFEKFTEPIFTLS